MTSNSRLCTISLPFTAEITWGQDVRISKLSSGEYQYLPVKPSQLHIVTKDDDFIVLCEDSIDCRDRCLEIKPDQIIRIEKSKVMEFIVTKTKELNAMQTHLNELISQKNIAEESIEKARTRQLRAEKNIIDADEKGKLVLETEIATLTKTIHDWEEKILYFKKLIEDRQNTIKQIQKEILKVG